ncbi:MAG: CCA tRNA nucleotidyltransferase [Lachnospiraceae bacterium]|nr:CCA tRNA nucleotidyltransferase [Lachnospiraceae bacterium]
MRIDIPDNANSILKILHDNGYEAYVVGGCVRDACLKKTPNDWDITTNARPERVKELFTKTIDTGLQHGTVTVRMNHESYEVTTYRVDGDYTDHRRPDKVTFSMSLAEDLKRRDFTINAMAYNDEEGLIDYYDGIGDLNKGIIRAVGNAYERFDEDALRILRAMRFAAQLGFSIEEETKKAMSDKAEFLRDISVERIREELTKLLISDHPRLLYEDGYKLGITKIILPEFDEMINTTQENPHHCYNVGMHSLVAVENIEADSTLRWAAFLHDVGKPKTKTMDEEGKCHFYDHANVGEPIAASIMTRLKFDNESIRRVKKLVFYHGYNWGDKLSDKVIRRATNKVGKEYMEDLFKLQKADVLAQSELLREEKLALLSAIADRYRQMLKEEQPMSLSDLAVNGNDLIKAGIKPGPKIGAILSNFLDLVIENPELNSREELISRVENLINE